MDEEKDEPSVKAPLGVGLFIVKKKQTYRCLDLLFSALLALP